ncbi:aromatic acid exporter family protein [Shouchella sp. JSM 1781072]|uniref:aromatic acid exporter family protein n=1 Tax=Bacillaceae TaxID=186817 RepID=UPI000C070B50|nr:MULTISPECIES: aromatic acid exporter family protein [Bacillaceae]UTR08014.1 aromatic acid exporter family protein [Alkalihalobacillus sp. LMS6]
MRFRIGYRTLKTAIGVFISLSIAQLLELNFASSAAIITILCISVTRKNSLLVSWARFVACMIGLVMSSILFEIIGYNPFAAALFILLFIPVVLLVKASDGIVTSSVIVMHLYVVEEVSVGFYWNELQLILIGIGTALLMNLYMPSKDKEMREQRKKVEALLKTTLNQLSTYIRAGESSWDGKELSQLDRVLKESKKTAFVAMQNHLLAEENHYYHYFTMREKQLEIIERLMPHLTRINGSVPQQEKVANFLDELSRAVSPTNSVAYFLLQLEEMRTEFRNMPLPKTREEFESRSSLLLIVFEFEQYLKTKDELWARKSDKKRPLRKS